jgi:hypothetical protein
VVVDRPAVSTVRSIRRGEADPGMQAALTRCLGACQPLDAATQALLTD